MKVFIEELKAYIEVVKQCLCIKAFEGDCLLAICEDMRESYTVEVEK